MNSIFSQIFFRLLRRAKHGSLFLTLPDGRVENFGEGHPEIRAEIRDWNAFGVLLRKGDLGLAQLIIDDRLRVDKMPELIEWACRNDEDLNQTLHGAWYGNLFAMAKHRLNQNSRKNAKANIMAHYDLGNDFYQLWLDPSMSYSSALFQGKVSDLQAAQLAKYDRIIDELAIKSSDHVLEIGCGWGGFFTRAVERTGCKVTAVMNSPRQAAHNRAEILKNDLSKHVELKQMDYRDIDGRFDKIVSIEMIEAVGEKYWGNFFAKVSDSLKPGGQALVQGITIREDLFPNYRKQTDFIQQHVFPGGMLLTNKAIEVESLKAGLQLRDTFEFGICYAETLKEWRRTFSGRLGEVRALGFDDRFIRLWDLYLGYCEGAFRAGRTNVGQFLLQK